jgi:hypothetical protein
MLRCATATFLLLALAGLGACRSDDGAAKKAAQTPAAPAAATSDPGSRYLDPAAPMGGVTVETPPTSGSWTQGGWPDGATSIARPAGTPASTGSPDGTLPPPVTRVPPPPPLPVRRR